MDDGGGGTTPVTCRASEVALSETHVRLEPRRPFQGSPSRRPSRVPQGQRRLKAEIMAQLAGVRAWGGVFAVPIPRLEVIP